MPHIDLYKAFGLDPATTSTELGRRLDDLSAGVDPANIPLREQLDTARRILGDPATRTAYDAQLADPAAPPIDEGRLSQLASGNTGNAPGVPAASQYPVPPAATGESPLILVLSAVAAVLVVAVVIVAVLVVRDSGSSSDKASTITTTQAENQAPNASAQQSVAQNAPAPPAPPEPPVEGAYPAAGGPRPATATPLPTYVSKYGKLTSAHLLTPTGGIGCDFNEADSEGKQGLCGIISFNKSNSPLGCVTRAGNCKGKWVFPFANNRVGDPTDSSGTTGWMNQPANDGYQVPKIPYGTQVYFQDWVCASEMNGLTCWNTSTGSGVFLSNQKAERFDGPGQAAAAPQEQPGGEAIVLGAPQSGGKGYGSTAPSEIFLGGASSTSQMTGITWSGWGSDRATGTGVGNYQPPNTSNAHLESGVPGTVVAYAPGTCNGTRAYTKIDYYFPSKGETFDEANGIDICTSR